MQIVKYMCDNHRVDRSKVLLIPPPPCNEEMWRNYMQQRDGCPVARSPKNNETTKLYFQACIETAQKLNCQTLSDSEGYWNALLSPDNFSDVLHFASQGSKTFFRFISKDLLAMTNHLPMILPPWRDVSP